MFCADLDLGEQAEAHLRVDLGGQTVGDGAGALVAYNALHNAQAAYKALHNKEYRQNVLII